MSKSLTAKQLGIPSGYRLSQANISNIIKVSIRHKFGDEMIAFAHKEAKLMIKCSKQIYKQKDIDEFKAASIKICGEDLMQDETELEFEIDGARCQLGGHYCYHNRTSGIISSDKFKSMLNQMTNFEFEKRFKIPSDQSSNDHLWRNEFCSIVTPTVKAQPSQPVRFKRLTAKTKADVIEFFAEYKSLNKRVEKHSTLTRSIANIYTSSAKLCNDAPEFVEWINDSKIYNANGHKCTDVSTHDMIAQLRQNK